MADRQHQPPPAAASQVTDEESGMEGESLRRSLFALDAMRQRGLIDEATWQERRRALIAADAGMSGQIPAGSNPAAGDGE